MATDGKIVLYDFDFSPCARRVRALLIEKGLDWETRIVDLTRMEQKHPSYLKLNPNGVVPTLDHDGKVIYESNVINEYLDAVFPSPRLYPEDPWLCAQVKMWQAWELSMAKEYRPLMYLRVIGPFDRQRPKDEVMADARRSTDDPAHLDWVSRVYDGTVLTDHETKLLEGQLYDRLNHLEKSLAGTDFLVGNRFTMADIAVYPRVVMYPMVKLPIEPSRYPNVTAWIARVGARPSITGSERARGGGQHSIG